MRKLVVLLAAAALAGCATVPARAPLEVALTIDDLPLHGPIPPGDTPQRVADELIGAFRAGGVTHVIGFVNGHWVAEQPATRDVLVAWRRAGLRLGNHGWAHRNLDEMTAAEFESELTRNEPLLSDLARGTDWHWFRYPFLAEGKDPAKLAAGRAVLARHGYKVAAVTMDFSDWQFTAPYARCVGKGDSGAIGQLERLYLSAAEEGIGRSRRLSQQVHGRDIPYVILLHGGAFTAHMMPRLLALFKARGFRFVGIEEAERDPAYRTDVAAAPTGPPATLNGQAEAKGVADGPMTDLTPTLTATCA